jgi:hypothetical protein
MQISQQVESPHVESTFKEDGQTWLKLYVCDTDYINKNGWGLSDQEVLDNLNNTGIGKPLLLTDEIYHPRGLHNIATAGLSNDQIISRMLEQQEKEAKVIGRHKSFYRDKENPKRIYSNLLVTDKLAIEAIDEGSIPQFVSAGAFLYDQPEGKGISRKFHFIHTSIVKKPAYPFAHAIIKAKCMGTEGKCTESLAVAGIQTEDNSDCKCKFVAKINSSSLSEAGQKSVSLMSVEETKKDVAPEVVEQTKQPSEAKVENKSPVKVITKEVIEQPKEEQNQNQPAPVNTDEYFKLLSGKNEELQKQLQILLAEKEQREIAKRKEIVASYVNRIFAHDAKKAEEETNKYLNGTYLKLTDEELIGCLKDRFGEQVIEVEARANRGKLKVAGIEEFITKDANLGGDNAKSNKKHPFLEFSSTISATGNGVY